MLSVGIGATPQKFAVTLLLTVGICLPALAAEGQCKPGGTKRVAFMMKQQTAFRYLHADMPFFKKTAEAAGYEVLVQSAENDAQAQVSQAENIITQGVDAIVINPVDFNVAAQIAEMASAAHIPLASYNDLITGADQVAYIGRDAQEGGMIAAKAILAKVPKGNYALIGGDPGQTGATDMQAGYHRIIGTSVQKGDVKIVMDQFAKGWKAEPAQAFAENALTQTDNRINAFLVSYDGESLAVMQAIEGAGLKPGSIPVTGQDMELAAMQAIVDGKMDGSVWPAPDEMGAAGAKVAIAMAQCQPIDAKDTVNNGVRNMPWVKTPIYYVDQASIANFCLRSRVLGASGGSLQELARKEAHLQVSIGTQRPRYADGRDGAASILQVRSLTKLFPGVVAVDNVDLDIAPKEIVALLGQNGAGKSTLIQVLSGLYPFGSYTGELTLGGAPLRCQSVADAERSGVAFLAQETNVAADLTVEEWLFLNDEPVRFGLIDRPLRRARAKAALADFGLDIQPTLRLGELDLASQQLVLIVRALSKNARLLILDEPTAALTDREAQRLFRSMRELSARGVAIIFVSHRLAEVFAISDRIVVMRDGRISGAFRTKETSRDAVVDLMIGRAAPRRGVSGKSIVGDIAIEAQDLTVRDAGGRELVSNINIGVRRGEVVGLFGLLGSGVAEATMALFGAWRGQTSGRVLVAGQQVSITQPADAVRLGIGLIVQDRRDGLSGEHSIYEMRFGPIWTPSADLVSSIERRRGARSLTCSRG